MSLISKNQCHGNPEHKLFSHTDAFSPQIVLEPLSSGANQGVCAHDNYIFIVFMNKDPLSDDISSYLLPISQP